MGFLNGVFGLVVNLCSFLLPSLYSYKALEAQNGWEAWLTYWVVFGAFSVVEHWTWFLVRRIPFWTIFKLAFVIWLQLPQTRVRPADTMHESKSCIFILPV